jgi:FtsZ-binding cell division protein ZapB
MDGYIEAIEDPMIHMTRLRVALHGRRYDYALSAYESHQAPYRELEHIVERAVGHCLNELAREVHGPHWKDKAVCERPTKQTKYENEELQRKVKELKVIVDHLSDERTTLLNERDALLKRVESLKDEILKYRNKLVERDAEILALQERLGPKPIVGDFGKAPVRKLICA